MRQSGRTLKQTRSFASRISGAAGVLLILGLWLAVPASATYETVDTFAEGQELKEQTLYGTSGMAVNVSGAGGVSAGTVYSVSEAGGGTPGVVRYDSKGELLDKWGSFRANGVAVDQVTGNVYVLTFDSEGVVKVYNADGSQLITSFGEPGAFKETIDEGPEKMHFSSNSGIAVDSSGIVYVSDRSLNGENRIMVFEPQSPGDYEHYAYAGRPNDRAVGYIPSNLALDSAGNLYVVGQVGIEEFAPDNPTAPVCKFEEPKAGILGMTVNSKSGEVFYFSYKDRKIHLLAPSCNAQGEFVETTAFAPVPKAIDIRALAFNPTLIYEGSRPPGVLYGANSYPQSASESILGYIFAPAEIHSPSVESESVSSVTSSTATLGAQINPKGFETRYAFQYITETAYQENEPADRFAGATEAPLGGAVLGSGQEALSAAASLAGLAPDTEYRYRVIATSHCDSEKAEELCEDIGPDEVFRTFPVEAPGLPDVRAYELVSPAQKFGGEVFPADPFGSCNACKPGRLAKRFPMQSAPDGEAVVYEGFPFSFTEGGKKFNEYLSMRTASGWQTTILSPLLQGDGLNQGHVAFNAELTHGLLYQVNPSLAPEAPSEYANLYAQPTATPSALTPLVGAEPPNRSPGYLSGNSFITTYAGASADFSQLFFEANDALTEETPFAPEAVDGGANKNNLYESAGGQLRLANVLPGNAETVPGAEFGSGKQLKSGNPNIITSDFSHAISDDGSRVFWSSESGQVYVREDGESTRAIPDPGKFLSASADGSKVLLSNGHIYDLEAEETTDLTQGEGGFQGILGQSEDLSRIYFVDTAMLTDEEENDHGAKAQADKYNLYAWHEGTSAFVATLLPEDKARGAAGKGDWQPSPSNRTAEASPNGRWVAFLSLAPLTGYDNTGRCGLNGKNEIVNAPCVEVFLYDSAAGKLTCPSCNPTGARPLGPSQLTLIEGAEGSFPQPRYLTDSGRLYFDSQDSITLFDTNDGVEDVYQYEPEGVGSCTREGGCVSLISAGHEPSDSNFLTTDLEGKSVFFTTRDQLVLKDRDDLVDLYVAREGGGIPAETETARGECQGEACQPAVIVPNDPTPGTATLEGAGNVVEKKAPKKHQKKARKKHRKKKHKNAKKPRSKRANDNRGGAK